MLQQRPVIDPPVEAVHLAPSPSPGRGEDAERRPPQLLRPVVGHPGQQRGGVAVWLGAVVEGRQRRCADHVGRARQFNRRRNELARANVPGADLDALALGRGQQVVQERAGGLAGRFAGGAAQVADGQAGSPSRRRQVEQQHLPAEQVASAI